MAAKKHKPLIANKKEVWHKIEMGILFDVYYDTETTGLDKRASEITQFGGVITDIAGNIMHMADYRAKPSGNFMFHPYARIIQRYAEKEAQKAPPQYILAGNIHRFFRLANDLREAPWQTKFLENCKTGDIVTPEGLEKQYYSYPLRNEDGSIDWDCVRVDEKLDKLYYKDPHSAIWIKRNISSMPYGYNNVRADDQWLWSLMHAAGMPNIFPTHLALEGKYRVDQLRAVEAAYAAGPQGKQAIKPLMVKDERSGHVRPSFRLGDIIKANTRYKNHVRDLSKGIRLPDGSHVDLKNLHGGLKDSIALMGLVQFMRRQVPDIQIQMERNSDWKDVVFRVMEKKDGFGTRPIFAYVDKRFPEVNGMMCTMIGTDQYRYQPKVGLAFNLTHDPRALRHRGRTMLEMTEDDFAELINEGRIFKIISTHHCPRILDAEAGFKAGFNEGLDHLTLHNRAEFLRKQLLTDRMMAGLRKARPRLGGPERLMLPQPFEELFTFTTLELNDAQTGEQVMVRQLMDTLKDPTLPDGTKAVFLKSASLAMRAQHSREKILKVKRLWLEAIQPDDYIMTLKDSSPEEEHEALGHFHKMLESINKKLTKIGGPLLPMPASLLETLEEAKEYKVKTLIWSAARHFQTGALQDISHHFWFEDRKGNKIDEETLMLWDQKKIDEASTNGDLTIKHERLNVTEPILLDILVQCGLWNALGKDTQEKLTAKRKLSIYGIPGHEGHNRWRAIDEAERAILEIRQNRITDQTIARIDHRAPGAWQKIMTPHHNLDKVLDECEKYIKRIKQELGPLTIEEKKRIGIDPYTNMPIEKLDYEVMPDRILAVPVPDRLLEKPVRRPFDAKKLWVAPLSEDFNAASLKDALRNRCQVVLESQIMAKRYHLPKASLFKLPGEGGAWTTFFDNIKARYSDNGINFDNLGGVVTLEGEGPYPLHNIRPIQLQTQSLILPKRYFEGLVNHKFASFNAPVSGIFLHDEALKLDPGPVRLLETDGGPGANQNGWEIQTNILSVTPLSPLQINKRLNAMKDADRWANKFGYPERQALESGIKEIFSALNKDPSDPDNTVLAVTFEKPDSYDPYCGTMFYNPSIPKISAVIDKHDL